VTGIRPYLSIITIDVNRLNSQITDTDWMSGFKKTRLNNMLLIRNSLHQ
jgi:hypothetical protein